MNRLMTFDKYRVFETEFAGRPLKVETGKMTQLANGACLVTTATQQFMLLLQHQKSQERALISSRFRLTMKKRCTQ